MSILIKKTKDLWISFTAFEDYFRCPRLYYWKRVRKLERTGFYLPYFIGRIFGPGVHQLFVDSKLAIKALGKSFDTEYKNIQKTYALSGEEEKELAEQRIVLLGMLQAYRARYGVFIKNTKIIKNEAPFHYTGIKGITVVGQLDNILLNGGGYYVHELKHTSALTPGYVKGIQTRLQPAMYKYMVNRIKDFGIKIKGVFFDVIQKPGIRVKKGESYQEYLVRLSNWYNDGAENKFHLERSKKLLLAEENVMNTVERVSNDIKRNGFEKEAYYQVFSSCCPDRGRVCDMYDLCHGEGGESNKVIMVQFKQKEKYHVKKN